MLDSCLSFACEPGLQVQQSTSVTHISSPIDSFLFNSVFIHGSDLKNLERLAMENSKVSAYVLPSSTSSNINELLINLGFQRICSVFGMHASIESFRSSKINTIRRVINRRDFDIWIELTTEVFGLKGKEKDLWISMQQGLIKSAKWQHFILDDFAAASVFKSTSTSLHLANVAVQTQNRRQGYGERISSEALTSLLDGITDLTLVATEMAKNVYERIGFRHVFTADYFEKVSAPRK